MLILKFCKAPLNSRIPARYKSFIIIIIIIIIIYFSKKSSKVAAAKLFVSKEQR